MKNKVWYWAPRLLAIIYVVFISLFALDVFGEGYSPLELAIAWTMHMIPSFVLMAITAVAWRWERIGGLLFLGLALFFAIFFKAYAEPSGLIVVGPLLLAGGLFLLHSPRGKQSAP